MKGLTAARVAGVVCTVTGWIVLAGGVAAALRLMAEPIDDDETRAVQVAAGFGIVAGSVAAWGMFVALGAAVKIGLRVLADLRAWRRPPPPV